jgi:hypothetical protein
MNMAQTWCSSVDSEVCLPHTNAHSRAQHAVVNVTLNEPS